MSSSDDLGLRIDPSVFKVLQKIPRHDAEALLTVIKLFATDPYFGDIQKMKGEKSVWRRRVGVYRIFFKLFAAERIILVFSIERRTSQTY